MGAEVMPYNSSRETMMPAGSMKDLDGDGVVSMAEYTADTDMDPDAGRVTNAMQAKRRQDAMIDADGDGVIDEAEKAALNASLNKSTMSQLDVPTEILAKFLEIEALCHQHDMDHN